MPPNTVYVGRPTKYGNPFSVKGWGQRAAVDMYWERLRSPVFGDLGFNLADLRGKDLACWCPLDQPCHADALLKEANRDTLYD